MKKIREKITDVSELEAIMVSVAQGELKIDEDGVFDPDTDDYYESTGKAPKNTLEVWAWTESACLAGVCSDDLSVYHRDKEGECDWDRKIAELNKVDGVYYANSL